MASGDVFANLNFDVTDGSIVTVQPAVGVQICVTFVSCQNNAYLSFGGENSTGQLSDGFTSGLNGTGARNVSMAQMDQSWNIKLFINNSQYLYFRCSDTTRDFAYSGIEI